MKNKFKQFGSFLAKENHLLVFVLTILIIFSFGTYTFARINPYTPNQTDDPSCTHSEENCFVQIFPTASTTVDQFLKIDSSGVMSWATVTATSGAGNVVSINDDTTASQYLEVAVATSTDANFRITTTGGHTYFSIPTQTGSVSNSLGLLSDSAYTIFNNKISSVVATTSSPISVNFVGTSTTDLYLDITKSSSSTDGYLSSGNFQTFWNKQNALTLGDATTTLPSIVTLSGSTANSIVGGNLSIDIAKSSSSTDGYLSAGNFETFWNKQDFLNFVPILNKSSTGTVQFGGLSNFGLANQIIGMNDAGTAYEYKSIVTSTSSVSNNVGITLNTPGSIIFNLPDASGTVRGILSTDDWGRFNGMLSREGGSMTGNITMTGTSTITGVPNPVNDSDVANKGYVLSLVNGLQWKVTVKLATLSSSTLTGYPTIDGVTVVSGDRILVKDQDNPTENGIYIATSTAWIRAGDAATGTALVSAAVAVSSGNTNANKAFVQTTAGPITLGSSAVNFVLFLNTTYSEGSGIKITGTTISSKLALGDGTGQSVIGGAGSGNLTLISNDTLHNGKVVFGAAGTSVYDENTDKFGIHNATPGYTLDVGGDINFTGKLLINGNAGTSTYILSSQGSSAAPHWVSLATALGNSVFSNGGNAFADNATLGTDGTSNFSLSFLTHGVNRMSISNSGNVNIGSATSSALFSVGNSTSTLFTVDSSGSASTKGLVVANLVATEDLISINPASGGAGTRFTGLITNADFTGSRTFTLPDVSGTFINTGTVGLITNPMIATGTIDFARLVGTDITTVGTISSGTWNGSIIDVAHGGTGASSTPYVVNVTDQTLTRTATTSGGFTLGLNLNSANTWTGTTTFNGITSFSATSGAFFTGTTGGIKVLSPSGLASNYTLTLPSLTADDVFVGKNTAAAFTNKTFDTASSNTLKIGGYQVSSLSGTSSTMVATVTPGIVVGNCLKYGTTGSIADAGAPCGTGSGALSGLASITAATSTNFINNANYNQTWAWNSIASSTAFFITSAATNTSLTASATLFKVALSGQPVSAGDITYAAVISNTASATSIVNVGLSVSASGAGGSAGKNYALIVPSGGGSVGIGTSAPTSQLEVVGNIVSKGTSWTVATAPGFGTITNFSGVTYGNGMFVAIAGNGGLNKFITSTDGIQWKSITVPAGQWKAMTYGNGLFVAVSSVNSIPGNNMIITSPDGVNWTVRTSPLSQLYSVGYGNGMFVATANGTANYITSSDGITWTLRSLPVTSTHAVGFGNGKFVLPNGSIVQTSTDGITFATSSSASTRSWKAVTYGNGLYVAVASDGTISNSVMTSPDGTTWTSRTSTLTNLWSVTYGSGLFVAVSGDTSTSNVMTSPDGINWTTRVTPLGSSNIKSVAYGNGVFVAVDELNGGTGIMYSGAPDTTTVQNNNIYQGGMSIMGNLGIGLSIASTTSLLHIVGTVPSSGNAAGITIVTATGSESNAGGSFSFTGGAGGNSTGLAGTGGGFTVVGGAGGNTSSGSSNSAGFGGVISLTAGKGGDETNNQPARIGAGVIITGGAGGSASTTTTTSGLGGKGGPVSIIGGEGGINSSTGGSSGTALGGDIDITGGRGGVTTSGPTLNGGKVTINGGAVGTGGSGGGLIGVVALQTTGGKVGIGTSIPTSQFNIIDNMVTSGIVADITSTSTGVANNNFTVLNVSSSGFTDSDNGNDKTYGIKISNTRNSSSTSIGYKTIGLYVTASGTVASANSNNGLNARNYAAIFENGWIGLETADPLSKFHIGTGNYRLPYTAGSSLTGAAALRIDDFTAAYGTVTGTGASAFTTFDTSSIGTMTVNNSIVGGPGGSITNASTLRIASAPVSGTGGGITTSHGLYIGTANVGSITSSYGLTVNTQTGATNNYAAAFLGGNVGIGTSTPTATLDVASVATTGTAMRVTANSLTSGIGLDLVSTSITGGKLLKISRTTGSAMTSGSALSIEDFVINAGGSGATTSLVPITFSGNRNGGSGDETVNGLNVSGTVSTNGSPSSITSTVNSILTNSTINIVNSASGVHTINGVKINPPTITSCTNAITNPAQCNFNGLYVTGGSDSRVTSVALNVNAGTALGTGVSYAALFSGGNVGINAAAPLDLFSIGGAPVASGTRALFNLSNTALSASSSAGGTYIGANATSTFAGDFINFQVASTTKFKISNLGVITATSDALINGITLGRGAGNSSTNTVFGNGALGSNNAIGVNNVAIGDNALHAASSTDSNVAIGHNALQTITIGSGSNIAIGSLAASNLTATSNTNNIFIGTSAGSGINANAVTNSLYLGGYAGIASGTATYFASPNDASRDGNIFISDGGGTVAMAFDNTKNLYLRGANYTSGCNDGSHALGTDTSGRVQCVTSTSDFRLKKDITSLDSLSGLAAIEKLNPVSYYWKDTSLPGNGTNALQFGFIAQDVMGILPNLVTTSTATYLTPDITYGLNYQGFTAVVVKAIQELDVQIKSINSIDPNQSGSLASLIAEYFINTAIKIKDLTLETLHIGTAEKPSGITMYDTVSKQPYCLTITNGQPVSTPGECVPISDSNDSNSNNTINTGSTTNNNSGILDISNIPPIDTASSTASSTQEVIPPTDTPVSSSGEVSTNPGDGETVQGDINPPTEVDVPLVDTPTN
jgi:hypothetical protein